MKTRAFFLLLLIVAGTSLLLAQNTLKTWEITEITLRSSVNSKNPYTDFINENKNALVTAVFTGVSGECTGKSITVPGFWDGGDTWKIRFAAPLPGKWDYVTSSSDRKMKGKKGSISVSAWTEQEKNEVPTRRGFIVVNDSPERKGRYFTYSDGTPCLWIGDTWWDWSNRNIKFESFKKLADTRAAQGFNIGQLFFAGNGWGEESSLLNAAYDMPDLEQIRRVEKMIAYANSKGITIWIHPWWSREAVDKSIGGEKMIRWWRYVVDRLHAYNVIWVLAGEYNMYNYGGFPLSFWNRLGETVKAEDPYNRITGAHPTPPMWEGGAAAPQWSTAEALHEQSWLDFNQSQTGHARWCNELTPDIIARAYAKTPAKPVVVTEPWYEFIEGNPTAMDIRFGAWSAMMSGAAGHSYGGGHTWLAHLPERPVEKGDWLMDTSLATNTLIYPGAVSVGFMGNYLRKLDWWNLEPHPEIVIDNPSKYCLAKPGTEYLFYLRYGGSMKIDLGSYPGKTFSYIWTDLVNNTSPATGKVTGGSVAEIKCPEDFPAVPEFKDWLLFLKSDN